MFEDLEAWQQARHLVNEIYSLTRENSSLSKDFGLTSQAAKGCCINHVERRWKGLNGRIFPRRIQFYNIARGSTGEVRSLLYVISRQLPTISTGSRTSERHCNLSWKARLRPFAVDRETERQTPTSTVASARPNLLSASLYLPMFR